MPLNLRQQLTQPKLRLTSQRLGSRTEPLALVGRHKAYDFMALKSAFSNFITRSRSVPGGHIKTVGFHCHQFCNYF